ncbi:GlxA family transcriptional regulator [Aeromicrobium sp. CF4.19]|uniref:GlxA family transcriptional regulator n=1 Tax=Aeromicrobium sp. CF4.19 TaxID=3373082 RepID=UPI003EE54382
MKPSERDQDARRSRTVAVAVIPGMPLFEIAVPLEVFATPRPGLVEPPYDVALCAEDPSADFGSFMLGSLSGLDVLAEADTVVVPALPTWDHDVPTALVDAIKTAHARGARVVGLCTGAFTLAAAGLLDGIPATTHWMYADQLAARHPRVKVDPNVLYAGTADVMTSAGTASGLDLCLELVRRDHGAAVANDVARGMVVAPHREGGQAQFIRPQPVAVADRSLAPVLDWSLEHLHEGITVGEMAAAGHVSTRTLSRHFGEQLGMTPTTWLTEQRVRRAQEHLERTTLTVAEIAATVGFESASTLRSQFHRIVGTSPRSYRTLFALE